jgi:hypothetical protein
VVLVWVAVTLEVNHLLAQEEDALLLQGGLNLRQPHQGPRHLQLGGHLKTDRCESGHLK